MRRLAVLAGLVLAACPPAKPAATVAPDATAAAEPAPLTAEELARADALVVNDCSMCHSEHMMRQQRLTPKQWEAVVKKMRGWGSPLEEADAPLLARRLSELYSTSAAPFEAARVPAASVVVALDPQPDGPFARGDRRRGAALWGEMCATCHGAAAEGADMGTALADRPVLHRAADFAAVTRVGRRRMPQFTDLTDADIGALLAHLRALPHHTL